MGQALSPAFPGFDQEQSDNNLQLALGHAHTFTPTTINELNIGFVQFRRQRRSVDAFTRNWIQELGIKGISPDPLTWAAPSMTPSGYPEIGYSSNNAVFKWVTQSAQIVDNFSAVRASHTLKAGLTIQLKRMTTIQWGQPSGTYTFSGQFSAPVPLVGHLSLQCAGRSASRVPFELYSPDHSVFATPVVYKHGLLHTGRLEND